MTDPTWVVAAWLLFVAVVLGFVVWLMVVTYREDNEGRRRRNRGGGG
jgi:ABC-type transporter Mla subunit MlaD